MTFILPEIRVIGFDADDTLWENLKFFEFTQTQFARLISDYVPDSSVLPAILDAAERRNIRHYGFGVKGFILSMIETAIEVTNADIPSAVIQQILDFGKSMLAHPVELLNGVHDTLTELSKTHPLILITKGDLLHQETKLAQSGLGDFFAGIEVVSDKDPQTYARILSRIGCSVDEFVMVGNSLKSDILPVLEIGGSAIYIPHTLSWSFEDAPIPNQHPKFHQIQHISDLLS